MQKEKFEEKTLEIFKSRGIEYSDLISKILDFAKRDGLSPTVKFYSIRGCQNNNTEGEPFYNDSIKAALHTFTFSGDERRDIYQFLKWDSDLITQLNVTFPKKTD